MSLAVEQPQHRLGSAISRAVPARGSHGRQVLLGATVGLVVGLLVVLPWISNGYLLLLDWISGPNQTITGGVYGINGGDVDGLPWRLAVQSMRALIGPAATAWLMILLFFPIAAAGMAHLVRGSTSQTVVVALLATCNPLVVTRIAAGHVPYLIGVACLPWLLASALNARRDGTWFSSRTAGWFAVGLAISPHMAWLGGTTLLIVALLPRPTLRSLVRLLLTSLAAATVYAYGIAVWLTGVRIPQVGTPDLAEYATRPGDAGSIVTVLSLRGYWRENTIDVGQALGYWWIPIVVAVVAFALLGISGFAGEHLARGPVLFAMLIVGTILSIGAQGPFGWLYRWAFEALPLFAVMREPLKWLPLILIPLAAGLARAVPIVSASLARLLHRLGPDSHLTGNPNASATATGRLPIALAAVLCALPAIFCLPYLLLGMGGRITTSQYPAGWSAANEAMGPGTGSVMFMPWHAYQPFIFTDGRAVATPARAFFARPVISSDAVELGSIRTDSDSSRALFLDEVVAKGARNASFGDLIAPVGIEFVAVAKDSSTPANFSWLAAQGGLTLFLDNPDMTVYRVDRAATGRVIGARQATSRDVQQLTNAGKMGTEAALPAGPSTPPVPSTQSGGLQRISATEWALASGSPGWVVLPEDWSAGWQLNGTAGVKTGQGLVAFESDGTGGQIVYRPWKFIRPAIVISVLALLALIVTGVLRNRAVARSGRNNTGTSTNYTGD